MKIKDYLNYKNGFYIEVGAHDGQYQSNTIDLEKNLNWNGLLIEPNNAIFKKCMNNRSIEKNIDEYLEQFNYEMLYREENDTFYRLKYDE